MRAYSTKGAMGAQSPGAMIADSDIHVDLFTVAASRPVSAPEATCVFVWLGRVRQ